MDRLAQWIEEHYNFTADNRLLCKRCGMEVTYVTKHARERHGDDVEVLPVREPALADKW